MAILLTGPYDFAIVPAFKLYMSTFRDISKIRLQVTIVLVYSTSLVALDGLLWFLYTRLPQGCSGVSMFHPLSHITHGRILFTSPATSVKQRPVKSEQIRDPLRAEHAK